MKILLFNGGPRRGNTWRLTEQARNYLETLDSTIEFSEVHLSELGLPFCTGCSSCFRKGHETCPHNAIVQPVIDMIEQSDAVIFSVPCYQGHLPGIMKNFTDHLAFMLHRPRFFTKKALIITTTGGVSASATTKALAATLPGWGFNKCYRLPVTAMSWNAYEPTKKHLKKTRKITKKFYRDVKSAKPHVPGIGVLIPFNLFQALCVGSKSGAEYPTKDNEFWQKYLGKTYAPGIPLTPGKRLFGRIFYLIGKCVARSAVVTYKK